MNNKTDILNEATERLREQEEKLISNIKEVINQWCGSLLIFAGLAIAALGNHHNFYAYTLILLWLLETLTVFLIFFINKLVYDRIAIRHFEGTHSEEQEEADLNWAERKNKQIKFLEQTAMLFFAIAAVSTMLYF